MNEFRVPMPSVLKKKSAKAPMGRFIVLGLPRSGTTYLMTLLNAHREVFCTGEQFNPYAIVGVEDHDHSEEAVIGRDRDPLAFFESVFAIAKKKGVTQAGFKFMLGHNLSVLRALVDDPDLRIIYVWRENRLAQIASLIKASQSKRWAQTEVDDYVKQTIEAGPRQISHRWHEYATIDFLASQWLNGLPNKKVTFEYRELFDAETPERLCDFLGVRPSRRMASPLIKQSANRVIDRFANPGPIEYYFKQIGREDWLGEEL